MSRRGRWNLRRIVVETIPEETIVREVISESFYYTLREIGFSREVAYEATMRALPPPRIELGPFCYNILKKQRKGKLYTPKEISWALKSLPRIRRVGKEFELNGFHKEVRPALYPWEEDHQTTKH